MLQMGVWIDGATVAEWEARLNGYPLHVARSVVLQRRIQKRIDVRPSLHRHYRNIVYNLMRWTSENGTKRFEDRFMRNFNKIHGKPGEVLVCIGDFSAKYKHMQYHSPRPLKRLIKRFKEAKHKVCLVDERYTSKRCCNCRRSTAECETFFVAQSRRPNNCNYGKLHGVLRCKECNNIFNRDLNACINIFYDAAYELVGQRPHHLRA